MSVQMLVGAPAYNKAPSPDKAPSEKLYPITMMIEQEHPVWVSLPQPDKLHLCVRLKADHFAALFKPNDAHDYGRMLMDRLATGLAGPVTHTWYLPDPKLYKQVQVGFGEGLHPVFFALSKTKGDPTGPHTLSIQFNPRLLSQEGAFELLDRLRTATGERLIVGAMLADARVSQLDVAIDIIGVGVADVLVRLKGEQSRCHRNGAVGDLEAIEIWRKGPKGAKAKFRSVIVYDKRAERIAALSPPPHDPAPVTRVEVTKKRFGNQPMLLSQLGDLANPLSGLAVGHVRAAAKPLSWSFLRYVDARRAVGPVRAAAHLSLAAACAAQFEEWYLLHGSDLVHGSSVWTRWGEGLEATGTALLIEAAKKKSPGVPLPEIE